MKLFELFSHSVIDLTSHSSTNIITEAIGREYQHLEDLLIDQGSQGGIDALQALKNIIQNPQSMNVKWDGIAGVFWGRNDKGEFVFAPQNQWNKGQMLTRQGLSDEIESTGRPKPGQTPQEFADTRRSMSSKYKRLWDIFEAATPENFKGYLNGDLMFSEPPERTADGDYEFTPNKITYTVKPGGLGGKIDQAKVFVAVHGKIDEFGVPPTGNLQRISDNAIAQFNRTPDLIVLPIQFPKEPLSDKNNAIIDAAISYINKNAKSIDNIANFSAPKMTGFKKILYDYSVKRAKQAVSFEDWLAGSKVSDNQKQILANSGILGSKDFDIFWTAYNKIADVKHKIWDQLHASHGGEMQKTLGITASVGGKPGGEGYAWPASPEQMVKMVNPNFRSAPDNPRFSGSITEAAAGKTAVWTFARMNPAHWAHENMVNLLSKIASQRSGDWFLFVSSSAKDPARNPLTYDEKVNWILQMMPEVKGHLVVDSSIKTPLQAATWLYNQGYRSIVYVAGEDDMPQYRKMIEDGNRHGENNPDAVAQGKGYYFGQLTDNNFEISPRLASATGARAAVSAGDRDGFANAIFGPTIGSRSPNVIDYAKNQLFDKVDAGMKAGEKLVKVKKTNETTSSGAKDRLSTDSTAITDESFGWVDEEVDREDWLAVSDASDIKVNHSSGTVVMLKMSIESATKLEKWCQINQVPCIPKNDLHLTILYSNSPVPHLMTMNGNHVQVTCRPKGWKILGQGALTINLTSTIADKFHKSLIRQGGTHNWDNYIPHTTVCYDWKHTGVPRSFPNFDLVYDTIMVEPIDTTYNPPAAR